MIPPTEKRSPPIYPKLVFIVSTFMLFLAIFLPIVEKKDE
ncbi:hypothetical protein L292_2677 [Acinetobacter junii CIP 107470 = MTCC 11364]|uniref:Uncharacterized protein n=1 Tax=Acinetobacter junii CIP 107470 = MTCC 11364 TaxID=1217666 RepID=S7WWI6_ACIJU|nr:hypothetical protein F953_00631 [Acinetobacter junii CIP 107470 = MTCC 11364]EPR86327.1 hypothetical protein L292_2677 [Acinetobacter junii CIP 107470 = MTCC 11364]